jgi:VIT1/CCC1 family predicted Fe2+/Mn2+ transporter
MTSSLATSVPGGDDGTAIAIGSARRSALEHATVREILMGAQDNLTNVLAVMLGVSIGSGRADLVALAGLSAAVAEAVSMGGVLYSSTRAERALDAREAVAVDTDLAPPVGLAPVVSGAATFGAALIGGLVPLMPFLFLPLPAAVPVSIAVSVAALFGLGIVIGRVSGTPPWRDGVRLVMVAGVAALAAAVVGAALPVG